MPCAGADRYSRRSKIASWPISKRVEGNGSTASAKDQSIAATKADVRAAPKSAPSHAKNLSDGIKICLSVHAQAPRQSE
jgi:siroheme synthase (precorrin-2 oxidase/ferrochelatase)